MKKRIREAVESFLAKRTKGDEGVTLIELMAVVVILAIIAAVAVPIVSNSVKSAHESATKQSEAVIADAINRYATDNNGDFPNIDPTVSTSAQTALQSYIQSIPQDGWGNNFTITSSSTNKTYSIITNTASPEVIQMDNTHSAPYTPPKQ